MSSMKREYVIFLGVLASLIVAATVFLYLPQGRKLDNLRVEIANQRAGLEADSAKASVIPKIQANIQRLHERYHNFDRQMPQKKELAGFLKELSTVLASKPLKNHLTEPGNPKSEEMYHTLPIIMKCQGRYLTLAELLEDIDRMERLTRIQRLNLRREKNSDDLNIEMQMNIYFTES